ncbi:DUF2267 domain-containing protein [Candidatus Poribacteria bacterium]|nr:DUF2267 domain-containing protein [Candidatus Poribacteria bacterium]
MKYDDFIKEVQTRGRLSSQGEAVQAIRATLEVLGQRITQKEAEHLASELPQEIGVYLRDAGDTERFDLDEFFERVNKIEKSSVDLAESVHHARAVISVVKDAISEGEINDILAQLPDEFEPLFKSGSEGPMNK